MARLIIEDFFVPFSGPAGIRQFKRLFFMTMTKQAQKTLGDNAVNTVRSLAEPKFTGEYQNLMKNLRAKLAKSGMILSGAAEVETGGVVSLGYTTMTGTPGTLERRYWPALNDKYRQRKPRSFRFWYKTGRLFDAFIAIPPVSASMTEIPSKRNHHAGKINTSFNIDFSPLPEELERIKIRESFVLGTRQKIYRMGIVIGDRNGLGRAVIPETTRDWMRALAAALGQDARKNLRKL